MRQRRNRASFNRLVFPVTILALSLLARPIVADSSILRWMNEIWFERGDGSALVATPSDDPVMRFAELAGENVVIRLVPMDSDGNDLGSGRVIVLGALEERQVRLRDTLTVQALAGVGLRAEVLLGDGHVMVSTSDSNGVRPLAARAARRRVVRRVEPIRRTSFALIDQAEAAGRLDGETAMIYRVFVLFGDARLPVEYRGDDRELRNDLYMAEVRNRFSTLSEAAQLTLQPFLTPPAYVGSWADVAESVTPFAIPPPCDALDFNDWGYVDSSNGHARVWHRLDRDLARARSIVSEIDSTIWPKLSALMAPGAPLPDLEEPCGGADRRLDIYLVDNERSQTVPFIACDGGTSPAFILLNRGVSDAIVAHEIFHAFQFSYRVAGCISAPQDAYRWWMEASAEWASEFIYPANDSKHWSASQKHWAAPLLLNIPEESLHVRKEPHWYGAYLLPFFLERITGWTPDFVRASWQQSATKPAIKAINDSLPESFEKVWPEFAKASWNRPPVDDYTRNEMPHKAYGDHGSALELHAIPETNAPVSFELPALSATYQHFKFDSDTARSVRFWNGATYNLNIEDFPQAGSVYYPREATPDQIKGGRIQALIKVRGQNWREEDWTRQKAVTFCRDFPNQRIDELVLIISNSDFEETDRKFKPAGIEPLVWASNIGCAKWKGTVTFTNSSFGLTVKTDVEWKLDETTFEWVGSGQGTWTFSGPCTGGNGTFTVDPATTEFFLFNFTPQFNPANRTYFAVGSKRQTVTTTCQGIPQGTDAIQWLYMPMPPNSPGVPGGRYLKVDESGSVMEGSHEPAGGMKWSWKFEAVQP